MKIDDKIEWTRLYNTLNDYGEFLVKTLKEKMRKNNSNASYTLTDSITYEVGIEDRGGVTKYWVDITLEDYWKYVNEGRKPGKMPPVDKIAEWIRVKPVKIRPLSEEMAIKSLSYAIQHSIKNKKGYAPPREALVGWINRKGIRPNLTPSIESLAYAIARKIGLYGTTGTHFFDDAVAEANDRYKDRIQDAIIDDINDFVEKIIEGNITLF